MGVDDKITDRDREVLHDLRDACDNLLDVTGIDWVRPLDCGGSNGSDHSYRLSKLAKLGLAEQHQRGGYTRGSKKYRITKAGRDLVPAATGRRTRVCP